MSSVRVARISTSPGIPFYYPGDRSGAVHRFPVYRLLITLAVVPRDYAGEPLPDVRGLFRQPAVLDTGAPSSIFPFAVWNRFADRVRWLDVPPGPVRRVVVLGGTFPYRLGRVKVGAVDSERRWLPPVTLTAFFLDDVPAAPREVVLGLRSRVLEGRLLRHEPDSDPDAPGRWWLQDPPPVSR